MGPLEVKSERVDRSERVSKSIERDKRSHSHPTHQQPSEARFGYLTVKLNIFTKTLDFEWSVDTIEMPEKYYSPRVMVSPSFILYGETTRFVMEHKECYYIYEGPYHGDHRTTVRIETEIKYLNVESVEMNGKKLTLNRHMDFHILHCYPVGFKLLCKATLETKMIGMKEGLLHRIIRNHLPSDIRFKSLDQSLESYPKTPILQSYADCFIQNHLNDETFVQILRFAFMTDNKILRYSVGKYFMSSTDEMKLHQQLDECIDGRDGWQKSAVKYLLSLSKVKAMYSIDDMKKRLSDPILESPESHVWSAETDDELLSLMVIESLQMMIFSEASSDGDLYLLVQDSKSNSETRLKFNRKLFETSSSQILRQMVDDTNHSDMVDDNDDCIIISGHGVKSVKYLLQYLTTGFTYIPELWDVIELYEMAEKFTISDLIESCLESLKFGMKYSNVIKILESVHSRRLDPVVKLCENFLIEIVTNFSKLDNLDLIEKNDQNLELQKLFMKITLIHAAKIREKSAAKADAKKRRLQ